MENFRLAKIPKFYYIISRTLWTGVSISWNCWSKSFWIPTVTLKIKHPGSVVIYSCSHVCGWEYVYVYTYVDARQEKVVRLFHYKTQKYWKEPCRGISTSLPSFIFVRNPLKKRYTILKLQKWLFWKARSMWNSIYIWGNYIIFTEMAAPIINLFDCKPSNCFQIA